MIMCKMTSKQGKNMSCTCAPLQTHKKGLTSKQKCDIINKLSRKAAKAVEKRERKNHRKKFEKTLDKLKKL